MLLRGQHLACATRFLVRPPPAAITQHAARIATIETARYRAHRGIATSDTVRYQVHLGIATGIALGSGVLLGIPARCDTTSEDGKHALSYSKKPSGEEPFKFEEKCLPGPRGLSAKVKPALTEFETERVKPEDPSPALTSFGMKLLPFALGASCIGCCVCEPISIVLGGCISCGILKRWTDYAKVSLRVPNEALPNTDLQVAVEMAVKEMLGEPVMKKAQAPHSIDHIEILGCKIEPGTLAINERTTFRAVVRFTPEDSSVRGPASKIIHLHSAALDKKLKYDAAVHMDVSLTEKKNFQQVRQVAYLKFQITDNDSLSLKGHDAASISIPMVDASSGLPQVFHYDYLSNWFYVFDELEYALWLKMGIAALKLNRWSNLDETNEKRKKAGLPPQKAFPEWEFVEE